MPDSDTSLQDTLAAMIAISIERSGLPDRELMIARIAALVASGAPAASYALNIGVAADVGMTLEDVQNILIAVAPIVGTARAATATVNIGRGLGLPVGTGPAGLDGGAAGA